MDSLNTLTDESVASMSVVNSVFASATAIPISVAVCTSNAVTSDAIEVRD
jgi:hypothetical protein